MMRAAPIRILIALLLLAAAMPAHAQIRLPGQPAPANPLKFDRGPAGRPIFESPFRDPNQPRTLPQPSIQQQRAPKVVNVDTALAKLMKDAGDFFATGMMEFWSTNSGQMEVKRFPFSLSVLEGRIRTELDLRYIPDVFDKTGTWSTMKQIGINRIVTVTLPRLSTVKVMFPSAESYVTQGLHVSDVPAYMRVVKRLAGQENLGEQVYDKYTGYLEYNTGDQIPVEIWQKPGAGSLPEYLKINHKAGNAVTVHFDRVQKGKVPINWFDTPETYSQYSDMGVMLQSVSARYEQEKVSQMPAVQRPNAGGIIRSRPDGSFPNSKLPGR